ncbi:hypothetical protein BOTBODRAFT_52950 [Botryobasidium botryosum FD-172 SS1]|uniref:ubiquitinyl hydrolase 1 n=1 Tax=Botryobasidium botryosum (strain FD-172 SS1) TaxID=930990 RepID=A0A067N1X2_BOTB1|nr:hypothetical protein BOTBODRAFT_52950 [Botryobasidium botryosum FD-172 SS1]
MSELPPPPETIPPPPGALNASRKSAPPADTAPTATTDKIGTATASSVRPGSSHTKFFAPLASSGTVPPNPSPPPYLKAEYPADYRPPEPLGSSPPGHDAMPELVYPEEDQTNPWISTNNDWEAGAGLAPFLSTWDYDSPDENLWWDKDYVSRLGPRPGVGMLPPKVAEALHDPDHALYQIIVSAPELPTSTSLSAPTTASAPNPASSAAQPAPPAYTSAPPPPPPTTSTPHITPDDLNVSIPHPRVLYSKQANAWVFLSVGAGALPPIIPSAQHRAFPDATRRQGTKNCLDEAASAAVNVWSNEAKTRTHHFHKYEKAVDGYSLEDPYLGKGVDKSFTPSSFSRVSLVDEPEFDRENKMDTGESPTAATTEEQPDGCAILDLYVCCQCQTYILASSESLPGVVSRESLEALVRERESNPAVGKTKEASVYSAITTLLSIIEKAIWGGNTRAVNVLGTGFQNRIGWNATVSDVFMQLGFSIVLPEPPLNQLRIALPNISPTTEAGQLARARLRRGWVELSSWIFLYSKQNARALRGYQGEQTLWVTALSAREDYQRAIGAHPDQVPRADLSHIDPSQFDRRAWSGLGMTLTTHSPDLVEYAYRRQIHCDPSLTPHYFEFLCKIANYGSLPGSLQLQSFVQVERSKGRWPREDVYRSAEMLGFSEDGELRIRWGDDVEDDFTLKAWWAAWRRVESYDLPKDDRDTTKRDLKEALRILSESKGSKELMHAYKQIMKRSTLGPNEAYAILGASKDFDDALMITVTELRITDQPTQRMRMLEALAFIAEERDSARLRKFIESGHDAGDSAQISHPEHPRGLNQLGNTCYLNSLLQYFFTIKDLRQAIDSGKFNDDIQLTDEDLKLHPIGGRLVTRREIERSRKFVKLLSGLFTNLTWSEMPAVTPEIELAKLALVTSKDEDDEKLASSSNTTATSATMVDSAPENDDMPGLETPDTVADLASLGRSSSILGKRRASGPLERSDPPDTTMSVAEGPGEGESEKDGFVIVPGRERIYGPPLPPPPPVADIAMANPTSPTADCEMKDGSQPELGEAIDRSSQTTLTQEAATEKAKVKNPPPLPPRRQKAEVKLDMMFGKQNDVAECMDNCMFQIEAAMQFDTTNASFGEVTGDVGLVKRLFYGKKRQRITAIEDEQRLIEPSVSAKDDVFAQLLVNVSDEGYDLYDGLSGFLDDTVELGGKKARMEVTLVDLPPILQIQLQRVQFNRDTLQQYKSNAYVKFEETLTMDRFLESADSEKKTKSRAIQVELKACRERIAALTQGQGAPYADAINNTISWVLHQDLQTYPELGVDEFLVEHLHAERDTLTAELAALRARAKVLKEEWESLWREDHSAEYELCSVFIHRGTSPSWGHYFFYSRNLPNNPDEWFKYNDSEVSMIKKDEVLADSTGSTANPYLLVYARKGANVIDTVHRQVITGVD